MARGDQLARQWMILQELLVSRHGNSAADLADSIQCNPRTIYRDLEALQSAGFPIYSEKVGAKSLWSLLDTMKHQMPLPVTLTELMALYFSRDMLKVFKDTVFYDSLESLFQKTRKTLPPESIKYLDKVQQTLHVSHKPYREYARFKEIINQVNEAAVSKRTVEIVYFSMTGKKETRRLVDPYKVWFFNGTFYLIGLCHKRGEVRMFALNRIKMLHLTKEKFEIPEDFNLEDFLRPSFGLYQGEPVIIKIRFSPEIAEYIREKIWHESQEIEEQEDGSVIYQVEVAGTEEIKHWVLSWGGKARVLEPGSLKDEIRAEAVQMMGQGGVVLSEGRNNVG